MIRPPPSAPPVTKLSIVIPARDEDGCIASTVEHLHLELRLHPPHEIIVVDDGKHGSDVADPCQTRRRCRSSGFATAARTASAAPSSSGSST